MLSVGVRLLRDDELPIELFESVLRMKLGWAGKWQVSVYIVGEEVVYQCDRGVGNREEEMTFLHPDASFFAIYSFP